MHVMSSSPHVTHTEAADNGHPLWAPCAQEVAYVSLGEKLKQLRAERGWSQDEFAHEANIDGRQVSRYENDKVTPSLDVVVKMARAYNVSLDFLLLEEAPRRSLDGAKNAKLAERLLSLDGISERSPPSSASPSAPSSQKTTRPRRNRGLVVRSMSASTRSSSYLDDSRTLLLRSSMPSLVRGQASGMFRCTKGAPLSFEKIFPAAVQVGLPT